MIVQIPIPPPLPLFGLETIGACDECGGMRALILVGPTYEVAAPCWHCARARISVDFLENL